MEAAAQMRHGYSYSDVHSDFPHEDEYFCKYIIINLHLHIWCMAFSIQGVPEKMSNYMVTTDRPSDKRTCFWDIWYMNYIFYSIVIKWQSVWV